VPTRVWGTEGVGVLRKTRINAGLSRHSRRTLASTPTRSGSGTQTRRARRSNSSPPSQPCSGPSLQRKLATGRAFGHCRGLSGAVERRFRHGEPHGGPARSLHYRRLASRADRNGSLSAFLKANLTPPERIVAQGWILGVPGLIRAGGERDNPASAVCNSPVSSLH
jgi:hypothetical protein